MSSHEPIQAHRRLSSGSDRNFGMAFCAIFLLIAIWPWLRHGDYIRVWAIIISAIFGFLGLFAAHLLSPLNQIWFKIGVAMHGIVSPIVMALLFFGAVTPTAFVLRVMKKDILRLNTSDQSTYWINRQPPGPDKNSMKNQF